MTRSLGKTLFVLGAVLVLASCAVKVTGGGSIVGANHATIAFNADTCGTNPKGQFEYVDHDTGVKLHGDVVGAGQCIAGGTTCQCQQLAPGFGLGAADYEIDAMYRSTNPAVPGEGHVTACVSDNGEGAKAASDTASIFVLDGPYAGYRNAGLVQGNVQHHKCPGKTTAP